MPIHFGTDGWRAVMSDTFTFANLRMVAQAIADALIADIKKTAPLKQHNGAPTVVVGFDTRFLSDRFAIDVARVLAANGLQVLLAQSDCPTPAISYAVVHHKALAGVMITASHNPPRYNGIKLKASYGGSVAKEQSHRVEVYLSDNETQGRGPNLMEYELAQDRGLIKRFDPIPHYRAHLEGLIDFDALKRTPRPVVVDAMYGSGRRVLANLLRECGWQVIEIRAEMNPGFGGIHPEPIDRYLGDLRAALAAAPGAFGLATDGDADRIGAMDEDGVFVDPHKIMALALGHLVTKRNLTGKVVRTVSTTHMLDRMAAEHGLDLVETPVGFNYIADHMIANGVLIGGEESGGISFKGNIPEGDGVLMGLLLAEIMASAGKPLNELVAELLAAYGPVFYERNDLRLKRPVDKGQMSQQLAENVPEAIGGRKVAQVAITDGVKYILDDGSWLLIRPSGTEPVLRVYAEGRSPEMLQALMDYGQQVAASIT
jgi:alpha-D-glucose phosphate-specific phosphoglucomutase